MKLVISYWLLVIGLFFFILTPSISATHDPDCTDMTNIECQVCTDEFGAHHVDTTWIGCKANAPGIAIRYGCDSRGGVHRTIVGEEVNGQCGQQSTTTGPAGPLDIKRVFGEIQPPSPLLPFLAQGGAGAGGISLFLNNLIALIYIITAVVFTFMLLFGALQWLLSGGDKEKVANARNRITHAIIGIVLFGVAFAVIQVVAKFTGFTFFTSVSQQGCPQRDDYYLEPPVTGQCIHKFYTGSQCVAIFQPVERRFCQ